MQYSGQVQADDDHQRNTGEPKDDVTHGISPEFDDWRPNARRRSKVPLRRLENRGSALWSRERPLISAQCQRLVHTRRADKQTMNNLNFTGATVAIFVALVATTLAAQADDLACISASFHLIGANDKLCVSAFYDPR